MSGKYYSDFGSKKWNALSLKDKAEILAREVDEGLRTITMSSQGGELFSIGFKDEVELELMRSTGHVKIIPNRASLEAFVADPNCKNKKIVNLVLGFMAPSDDKPENAETDAMPTAEFNKKAKQEADETVQGLRKPYVLGQLGSLYRIEFLTADSAHVYDFGNELKGFLADKAQIKDVAQSEDCTNTEDAMAVWEHLPDDYVCG